MATITKKELVELIAQRSSLDRPLVKSILCQFLDQIIAELSQGNRLEFRDFGVFEVKTRAARSAQNPRTLTKVTVPARKTVRFKPGRFMKNALATPSLAMPPAMVEPKPARKAATSPAARASGKADNGEG
jgi:integration host factor subunit beta